MATLRLGVNGLGKNTLGAVATQRAAIGGLPQPIITYMRYRVLDPLTGAVVLDPLPHLHKSTWRVNFNEPGATGSVQVGDFNIPLPDPLSDEYIKNVGLYALLSEGQRIEGYESRDGESIGGAPQQSGVIRELPTELNNYSIKGTDSLFLLQQARTKRTEYWSDTTDQLARLAMRTYQLVHGDDFAHPNLIPDWSFEDATLAALQNSWVLGTPAEFSIDATATNFQVGSQSLKCTTTRTASGWNTVEPKAQVGSFGEIPVTPGVAYDYSVWWKQTAGAKQTHFKVEYYKADGTTFVSVDFVFGGTDGVQPWTRTTGTFTPPAGAAYARVICMYGWWDGVTGTNAQIWFDDVEMAVSVAGPKYSPLNGLWSATTDEGLAAFVASGQTTAKPAVLATQTSFAASNYTDCAISAWFKATLGDFTTKWIVGNADTVACTRFGIIAAMGAASYVLGAVNVRQTGPLRWEADLIIATGVVTAGVPQAPTSQTVRTVVVTEPINSMRAMVTLIGKQGTKNASGQFLPNPAGPDYLWRLTINGLDAGCTLIQLATTPSGSVGVGYLTDTAALTTGKSAPQASAANVVFQNRGNAFQPGIINVGTRTIAQLFSRTPNLDLLQIAATTEGFVARKTAGAGLNQDVIDFGPTIGSQVGSQVGIGADQVVTFDERNVQAASKTANSNPLATEIALQVASGADTSGSIDWLNIAAAKKYGIVTEALTAQNIADSLAARVLGQTMALIKGNPGQAKKITVTRDAETHGRWREGDWVKVNVPRIGLNNSRSQIMGYTYEEGKAEQQVTLDKFPIDMAEVVLRRMWQTLDALATGTSSLSPTSSTGLVYDSRIGTPTVIPFDGAYLAMDSTHNYRMRFNIPQNVVMIQKVTLAWTFMPYRTYSSFNVTSTGAGSAHNHAQGTSGAGSAHTHSIHITAPSGAAATLSSGGSGSNIIDNLALNSYDTAQVVNAESAHTHALGNGGTEASHTHTVTGSSTLGIAESTQPSGATILIDGVDRTSALGGPWSGGGGNQTDFPEIDITPYVLGGGFHEIQFSSTQLGAMAAQVYCYVLVKPAA